MKDPINNTPTSKRLQK